MNKNKTYFSSTENTIMHEFKEIKNMNDLLVNANIRKEKKRYMKKLEIKLRKKNRKVTYS
jgi:hypothetical protein